MRTRLAVILAFVAVLAVVPALHAGHTHGYASGGHNGDLHAGCALCSFAPTVSLAGDGAPAEHIDESPAALVLSFSARSHQLHITSPIGSRAPPRAR